MIMRFVAKAQLASGDKLEAPYDVPSDEYTPTVAAEAGLAALEAKGAVSPNPTDQRVREGRLEGQEIREWGYHEAPPVPEGEGITAEDLANQDPDNPIQRNPDAGPISQEELEARGTAPEVTTEVQPKKSRRR
jgi:hypothetical protein